MKVVFHSEATAELAEAIDFYDHRRPGLGSEFLDEVQRTVSAIHDFTKIGPAYKKTGFRHCVLRRFPYIVFYLEMTELLWIVAVAHGSRRPGYWRRRTFEPPHSNLPAP